MKKYTVDNIPKQQTHEWLKYKHYAKIIPIIIYSFGLYDVSLTLQGVCTYGPPARMLNNGHGVFGGNLEVMTLELNRIITNDNLPKNMLSFFLAKTFKQLPSPSCLVSYADSTAGHHGYIYQATNWLYCGETKPEKIYLNKETNKPIHPRIINKMFVSRASKAMPNGIEVSVKDGGKHKYIKFIGSKKEVKNMRKNLAYKILPYPKGENKNYNATYEPSFQLKAF